MTDLLQQARDALHAERRHRNRGVRVRLTQVERHDARILTARVHADVPADPSWRGGTIVRSLLDGPDVVPFRADVLDVDADDDQIWLEHVGDPLPDEGEAWLYPFDFLKAPDKLLNHPDPGVRDRLRVALEAARNGDLALEIDGPPRLAPAWRHDRVWVWGPPGTGKTTTIARNVDALLDDPTERVLITSTTHRATDELARRVGDLRRHDLAPLARFGVGRASPHGAWEGLTAMLRLPDAAVLAEIQALAAVPPGGARGAAAQARIKQLRADLPTLTKALDDDTLRAAFVTVHAALSTLASDDALTRLQRGEPPFTTVIVDEAGLVGRLQAACIGLLASRRVVLVGDPQQLSPIASAPRTSPRDQLRWLATSAIDHLRPDTRDAAVQRLTEQWRMHPEVRRVVSEFSYGGTLTDGAGVLGRRLGALALERLPRATWYVLDEHGGPRAELSAERGPNHRSYRRPVLTKVLGALLDAHPELRDKDVLCVAPYRAQVELLRGWIEERGLSRWRAGSVHAQQGTEADVVVFDTVRASSAGWSAEEWRRLVNVGMSRARHLLFVVATRGELDQPPLRPLRALLAPRVLHNGRWRDVGATGDDRGLFAPTPSITTAPPPDPLPTGDALGAQLARQRRMRPLLSREQSALVHRDLGAGGPRLVRGVAGSGKTLVLAHWAVRALHGLGVPSVTVVYANHALRDLLWDMLHGAWASLHPAPGPLPVDRIDVVYVGDLLDRLERDAGVPVAAGAARFDFDERARRLPTPTPPRFDVLFIDEAQDIGHDALRCLIGLTRTVDGAPQVMVFYDNAQNVYGRPPPRWTELGLDLRGRSDVMRQSFRSTRPNVELALNALHALRPLTADPELRELMRDDPPLLRQDEHQRWRADFCASDGQRPQVRVVDAVSDEVALITRQVKRWLDEQVRPGDIRVLALVQAFRDRIVAALTDALPGVRVVERRTEGFADATDAVVVTTPHSFKGHDAELIIVAGAERFVAGGEPLTAALYVALTRARSLLLVTGTRTPDPVGGRILAALEAAAAPPPDPSPHADET